MRIVSPAAERHIDRPVINVRAGMPATRPAEETAAAELAEVCAKFDSPIVNGVRSAQRRGRAAKIAYAISAPVTLMLLDQPTFSPL